MKVAYLPWYTRDWRSDPKVALLSWEERSLYRDMIDLSWELGPLPDDAAAVVRALGAPDRLVESVPGILARFWTKVRAGWTNPRLERERKRTKEMIERRTDLGKKGAAARWEKDAAGNAHGNAPGNAHGIAHGNAGGMPRAPEPEPSEGSTSSKVFPAPPVLGEDPATAGAPPPPKKPGRRKQVEWTGSIPEALRTPAFVEEWAGWLRYRRTEHKAREVVTQSAGDLQLQEFEEWGPERAVRAIKHTRKSQWQGIREPDAPRNGFHRPTARERQDAEIRAGLDEVHKLFHGTEVQHESA